MMKAKRKHKAKSIWKNWINGLVKPVTISFRVSRRLEECAAQFEYYEAYNWQHAIKPTIVQPVETAIIQQEDGNYAFHIKRIRNSNGFVFSDSSVEPNGYLYYEAESYTYVKGHINFYYEAVSHTYKLQILVSILLLIISLIDIPHNFPVLSVPAITMVGTIMDISDRLQDRNRLAAIIEITLKKKQAEFQVIAKNTDTNLL